MKDTIKEILETAEKINEEFINSSKNDDYPVISVIIFYEYEAIVLYVEDIEIPIWDSVNDDRLFNEDKNEYESFYKLIKRKIMKAKSRINLVKVNAKKNL